MSKANAVGDGTGLGCSKINGAETSTGINGAGTIYNKRPVEIKSEIDIVIREKQIDVNNEIYYTFK